MKLRSLFVMLSLMLSSVGLVLVIVGYFSHTHARSLVGKGVPARGVVIGYKTNISNTVDATGGGSEETTYQPQIRFQTNTGKNVEFLAMGARSREYAVGSVLPVIYDPQHPSDAMLQTDATGASKLGLVIGGGITLLLGIFSIAVLSFVNKKLAWLRENGRRVYADFIRVDRADGDSSALYTVVCQWADPETKQVHEFTSESLAADPSRMLAGKKIEVVMDPAKPTRYIVEVAPVIQQLRRAG